MKDKNEGSTNELLSEGLNEETPFDPKVSPRGEVDEQSQRPTARHDSITSDRGTFKTK